MSETIDWGRADVTWEPGGYHLVVPIDMPERARALFDAQVLELAKRVNAMFSRDLRTHVGPSQLELRSEHLLMTAPGRLRSALNDLAGACIAEADGREREDNRVIPGWLAGLRRVDG